jgi:6-phosphogluconolactonase
MSMKVVSAKGDLEAAFDKAAKAIFAACERVPHGNEPVIALCGGRSVVGLLGALKRESAHQPAGLMQRVHFFMADERLVPLSDENSNYGALHRLLFADLVKDGTIRAEQLHPLNPDPRESDHGCAAYADELGRFGGKFTVVVLGIGEDGHVAGLFPNHPVLQRREKTFFSFYDSPKPPPQRMTASAQLIREAELCVLLALGEGKREAWTRFSKAETSFEECPSVIGKEVKESVVVTDLN